MRLTPTNAPAAPAPAVLQSILSRTPANAFALPLR